jgi:hypothetical protein
MDVVRVHDRLIDDYRELTGSFGDIREHVAECTTMGYQWPDPWSLGQDFASGGTITGLVAEGLPQEERERIFRLVVSPVGSRPGERRTYFVPIIDRVLVAKVAGTYAPGIKAAVVSTMNVQANSLPRELEKFLAIGYPKRPPVTFDCDTGQESAETSRSLSELSYFGSPVLVGESN